MSDRALGVLRLVCAVSFIWLQAPMPAGFAKEMGVVEDLSVGRHTMSPFGGLGRYQNLLTYSEQFDNGAWVKSASTTVPATNITAPDGDADAESITFGSAGLDTIKQDSNVTAASTQFAGSVWLKVASGSLTVRIGVIDEAGTPAGTYASAALDTTWQRFQVTHTFAAGATGTANLIIDDNTNGTSQTIHAWGAQLESAVGTAGVYVKTVAAALSTAYRGAVSNATKIADGDLLYLGAASADPSGANGAMYYSTGTNKFRCYQASAWTDCIGAGGGSGDITDVGNCATGACFTGTSGTTITLDGAPDVDPTIASDANGDLTLSAAGGTVKVGSGTGNIDLSLTAAGNLFTGLKSLTPGAAYSDIDFTFRRTLAGTQTKGGSVVRIDDTSSGGTINPNLLLINAAGTGSTLLRAQAAGVDKFVVDGNGAITTGSISVATNLAGGSAGTLPYQSAASTTAMLAAGSAGQVLRSGGAGAPAWSTATYPATAGTAGKVLRSDGTNFLSSTATYPDTTTVSQLLYSSAANTIAGLATANNGVLVTSGTGVPSIATDLPTAVTIGGGAIYRAGGTDVAVADGGTGTSTAFTTGSVVFAGGSGVYGQDNANLFWDDTNNRLGIGTTGPGYLLDIAGSGAGTLDVARLRNTVAAANNSASQLLFASNRTTSGLTNVAGVAGMITDISDTAYKGALIFSTANNAAPANRLSINNIGDLTFSGDGSSGDTVLLKGENLGGYGVNLTLQGGPGGGGGFGGNINLQGGYNSGTGDERSVYVLDASSGNQVIKFTDDASENGIVSSIGNRDLKITTTNSGSNTNSGNLYLIGADGAAPFGSGNEIGGSVYVQSGVGGGTSPNGNIIFRLGASTELARITSAGNVGIGTTSPGAKLHLNSPSGTSTVTLNMTAYGNTGAPYTITRTDPNSGNGYVDFHESFNTSDVTFSLQNPSQNMVKLSAAGGGAATLSVYDGANNVKTLLHGAGDSYFNGGNVGIGQASPDQGKVEVKGGTVCVDTNSDNNATSCIASESDIRLKTNIVPIEGALAKLLALRGVEFDWKTTDPNIVSQYPLITRFSDRPHSMGVIGQEVEKVFPEAMMEETEGGFKQVRYELLVAPVIEAIRGLKADNDALKAKNAELEARLDALEAKLP